MKKSNRGGRLRFSVRQKQRLSISVRIAAGVSFVLVFTAISFLFIHLASTEDVRAVSSGVTTVSTGTAGKNGARTLTWNHNVTAGTNQVLIVGVTAQDKPVTSVTYNGSAMTYAGSVTKNSMYICIYYLFNPTAGNFQIKVTASSNTDLYAGSALLSGVSTSSPLSTVTNSGTSSAPNSSAVTATSSNYVFSVLGTVSRNPSPSGSITEVYEVGSSHYNAASIRLGVSPSVTLTYSLGSTANWGMVSVALSTAVTLPVTWKSFELAIENGSVVANWVTASEINNDRFVLEKSADGISFEQVTSVSGSGNATYDNFYSAIDHSAPQQLTYYRVKQIDYDGKFDYSEVKVVNPELAKKEIMIFPTVVTTFLNVQYAAGEKKGTATYRIINYSGRQIATGNLDLGDLENSSRIDLPDLPFGNYIFILESNGEVLGKSKFLKSL